MPYGLPRCTQVSISFFRSSHRATPICDARTNRLPKPAALCAELPGRRARPLEPETLAQAGASAGNSSVLPFRPASAARGATPSRSTRSGRTAAVPPLGLRAGHRPRRSIRAACARRCGLRTRSATKGNGRPGFETGRRGTRQVLAEHLREHLRGGDAFEQHRAGIRSPAEPAPAPSGSRATARIARRSSASARQPVRVERVNHHGVPQQHAVGRVRRRARSVIAVTPSGTRTRVPSDVAM